MIDRQSCGLLPAKLHTVLRAPDGGLLYEEMFTREGFDGPFSAFYHRFPITAAREVLASDRGWARPVLVEEGIYPLRRRLYDGNALWASLLAAGPRPAVDARAPLLFNEDLVLLLAAPPRTTTSTSPTGTATSSGTSCRARPSWRAAAGCST